MNCGVARRVNATVTSAQPNSSEPNQQYFVMSTATSIRMRTSSVDFLSSGMMQLGDAVHALLGAILREDNRTRISCHHIAHTWRTRKTKGSTLEDRGAVAVCGAPDKESIKCRNAVGASAETTSASTSGCSEVVCPTFGCCASSMRLRIFAILKLQIEILVDRTHY